MRNAIPAALAVILLTGCPPKENPYGYGGTLMYEFFPFDGIRTWEFISTNEDLLLTVSDDLPLDAGFLSAPIQLLQSTILGRSRTAVLACHDGEPIYLLTTKPRPAGTIPTTSTKS